MHRFNEHRYTTGSEGARLHRRIRRLLISKVVFQRDERFSRLVCGWRRDSIVGGLILLGIELSHAEDDVSQSTQSTQDEGHSQ